MRQIATMILRHALLSATIWASSAGCATAQQASDVASQTRQAHLRGLSAAEAGALVEKLQDLQRRLRGGEDLFFELLSGAPASYPMTQVSPRDAFLQMPFHDAFMIERVQTDNRSWQPFRLTLTPNGPGQLIWDVRVVLGFHGQVERVEMVYRPPPPF